VISGSLVKPTIKSDDVPYAEGLGALGGEVDLAASYAGHPRHISLGGD